MKRHILQTKTHRKPNVLVNLSLGMWLALCLFFMILVINNDLNQVSKAFNNTNTQIVANISDRILVAETALEGFASHIHSEKAIDHVYLSRVADNLLQIYPFLYMFEIAQRVENSQREHIEKKLSLIYPDFRIRQFDYNKSKQWIDPGNKQFYFPIIFQGPFYQDNRNILGLDLTASETLIQAMEASNNKGIAVASMPFMLAENLNGYVIHRAINRAEGFQSKPFKHEFYALLAIASDKMFSLPDSVDPRVHFSIHHPGFEKGLFTQTLVYQNANEIEENNRSLFFPLLSFAKSISNTTPSQPFLINTHLQLNLKDFSYNLLLIIMFSAFSIPLLARSYVRNFFVDELLKFDDKEELYRLANFDQLTGLPNRTRLNDHLERLIVTASRERKSFTVFFIDIDNFKPINDTHGHSFGDYVLCEFSLRLSKNIRENELLSRLGGDEFVLVTDNHLTDSMIETVKSRIKSQFVDAIRSGGKEVIVKVSIGNATFPNDGKNILALLDKADRAMYEEKRTKQNSLHVIK